MKQYDYIIAGAGAAGLSLAWHLARTPLREKFILLIDKAPKAGNDRTWCFWERGSGPFEEIVCRQWKEMYFYGTDFRSLMDLGDYRYKMIRSADFYRFVQEELAKLPNLQWVYGDITGLQDEQDRAAVTVNGQTYYGNWVFDSRFDPSGMERNPDRHYLLQHFKGWEVATDHSFFRPDEATLMDFRIAQHGETRFFYVLPFDRHRALIEFTVFSGALLPEADYDRELTAYLRAYLQLDSWKVLHEEFGVIPMTDHSFPKNRGKRIILIGTAGGRTKASTGYTFRRIGQHAHALAQALLETGQPFPKLPWKRHFELYDSMLLRIMDRQRYSMKDIFTLLFRRNPPGRILKFLDEDTSFAEDLQIMASVPSFPFLQALVGVAASRLKTR